MEKKFEANNASYITITAGSKKVTVTVQIADKDEAEKETSTDAQGDAVYATIEPKAKTPMATMLEAKADVVAEQIAVVTGEEAAPKAKKSKSSKAKGKKAKAAEGTVTTNVTATEGMASTNEAAANYMIVEVETEEPTPAADDTATELPEPPAGETDDEAIEQASETPTATAAATATTEVPAAGDEDEDGALTDEELSDLRQKAKTFLKAAPDNRDKVKAWLAARGLERVTAMPKATVPEFLAFIAGESAAA